MINSPLKEPYNRKVNYNCAFVHTDMKVDSVALKIVKHSYQLCMTKYNISDEYDICDNLTSNNSDRMRVRYSES